MKQKLLYKSVATMKILVGLVAGLGGSLLLALSGCSKAVTNDGVAAQPLKPKEAASQLQQAFVSNVELAPQAKAASEALRGADYEKAVQSLTAIKARENLTLEQGMAVHNSMVSLEAKLIGAMEAGDPNAKRAYEALRKSRRN